ncbi:cysteine desulfurase [Stackebrandtia endophytica]|uniref:Cysteine desulfurase n=1 Tax=Stackebrandtia endophytica TaxID=1496996 RepID=A0A543ARR5_9ACTN|nr:cysteine desulfurase family protein [Stackebrandtia endophytica]TQL75272.1 cysteine desulfurase [Stackebrandtia endophytica]
MTYLDHAATTPMLEAAKEAYLAAAGVGGNASALHSGGRAARRIVEESRERIADRLGAAPSEVVFTSGATEGNNLAVKGLYWGRRDAEPDRRRILVNPAEHHAVLDVIEWLARHEGARIEWLPVTVDGRVEVEAVAEVLATGSEDIALMTLMWANNEVGAINPMADIARLAADAGVPLHTDAVQAVAHVPLSFAEPGFTALSLTGHKFGGPTGVGALLLRKDAPVVPLAHGGGQERDVRSGTLDVPGIAALAAAVTVAVDAQQAEAERLTRLRDRLIGRVREVVPTAILNGPESDRLPGNAHFSFPGCEGDALLMVLDAAGVECATGSACSAGVAQPSHVLLAMGSTVAHARSSLRFTLGHTSTDADIDALIAALPSAVERARAAGLS